MKAEAEANGPAEGSLVAELGDDHPGEAAAEAAGPGAGQATVVSLRCGGCRGAGRPVAGA